MVDGQRPDASVTHEVGRDVRFFLGLPSTDGGQAGEAGADAAPPGVTPGVPAPVDPSFRRRARRPSASAAIAIVMCRRLRRDARLPFPPLLARRAEDGTRRACPPWPILLPLVAPDPRVGVGDVRPSTFWSIESSISNSWSSSPAGAETVRRRLRFGVSALRERESSLSLICMAEPMRCEGGG
jgi:hypothetical protein